MKKVLLLTGPWVSIAVFWIVRLAGADLIISVLVGTGYAVGYWFFARHEGCLTRLDHGVAVFFMAGLAVMLAKSSLGPMYFITYFTSCLYACLFMACFLPLFVRARSFTVAIARRVTPPEYWEHEVFLKINAYISSIWEVIFVISFLVALFPSVWFRYVLPNLLCLTIGLPVTKFFPTLYMRVNKMGPPAQGIEGTQGSRQTQEKATGRAHE